MWRDCRRLLLKDYQQMIYEAMSGLYYDPNDVMEVALFQGLVLDLINTELEQYRTLHNNRPNRLMNHKSPNQVKQTSHSFFLINSCIQSTFIGV